MVKMVDQKNRVHIDLMFFSFLSVELVTSVSSCASYPDIDTACIISETETTAGSYVTAIFSVAKFTLDSMTPSTLLVAFSMVWTHDAQVMPVTANVFCSVSVKALYPDLSTPA